MTISRHAAGSISAVSSTTCSPTIPTNSVGDILIYTLVTSGTPTSGPSGWSLLGSSTTVTSAKVYVWGVAVSSVMSGTATATMSASSTNRGQITSYSGVDTNATPVVVATSSTTASTTITSGSATFGDYVFWANGRSAASTLSGETSSAGTWTASEAIENSGTNAMTVTDGPITAGTTASLSATSSASVTWNSLVVVLTEPTSNLSDTAALSASATLGDSSTPALNQTASVGATAALAATSTPAPTTAAAFSATSALSATGTPAVPRSAALSASSTLATGSSAGPRQSPALSATAALASNGILAQGSTGTAALNPIASLTASSTPKLTTTAPLSPTVSLAQTDTVKVSNTAAVGATASLSATASVAMSKTSALAAIASLAGTGSISGAAGLSASATLSATKTFGLNPSAGLTPTVSLSATTAMTVAKSAALSVSAGLNSTRSIGYASPLTATAGLSASGLVYMPIVLPSSLRVFDMRLRAATPLGPQGAVIPDLGFTIAATDNGGSTLSAKVSTAVYGTIPQYLEVIVEWWHVSTQQWQEGRDSRFIITQFDTDDRDRTGTVTMTGVDIGTFFYSAAVLKGVDPYVNTTGTSEAARTNSTVSVSGTTFTWAGHVLSAGDRVRITSVGKATRLQSNSVYFVKNPTSNTFQLAVTANGAALNCGTATNVSMSRVVTRIVFSGTHSFTKSDSVSVLGGTALGLNDGNQYYVVNPTSTTIQITDTPGGVPIELKAANTNVSQVYRFLDGQRVFSNAHPGTIMSTAFLEARGRGWGVGSDGTTMLTHSWTVGADSQGQPWSTMADDPTTPGISIGFQPGTPTSQILQTMIDNQYAEWYVAPGRTLALVNPQTGVDQTTRSNPIRIGTTASAVKVQTDLTQLRNAITVRGTGPILTEVDGVTTGAFGRLEMYETASGATSKTLAAAQGKTDLSAHSAATVAYTVTEMAEQSAWLPLKDYSRGDWVACQLQNTGWSSLRVVGWQFQKQPGSPITVTTNLAAIKKTLQSKIVRKITNVTSGISASSTGQSLLETDNRKATAPAGLTVVTNGFFALDNTSQSTATVSWLPVVTDIVGGDVQTTMYDVWLRPEGKQFGQSAGHTTGLSLDITPLPSGHTYAVSVRAQTSGGQWGEFSDEVEFTTSYSFAIPNIPTTPTVTGSLGSVRVAWDGNLIDANGNVVAASDATNNGFAYVYTQYALSSAVLLSSGGTTVGQDMGHAGYTVVGGLTVGVTYYFALFAVNSVGVVSSISAVQSFTVVGISGPDLLANSVTANQMAAGSITTDKLDVGTIPQGTPQDRVAMPLTQSAFWSLAAGGSSAVYAAATGASATSSGVTLAANGILWITQKLSDAPSSYIYLQGLATTGTATFYVREWSTATAYTDTAVALTVTGTQYTLQSTTINYSVYIKNTSTTASVTISAAHVTEALGSGYNYEGATIQPDGLRIYSGENANPILALTSSSDDVLSLSSATGDQVATIDTAGNAGFTTVTMGAGSAIDGIDLILDPTDPGFLDQSGPIGYMGATLSESSPNGNGWTRGDVTLPDGSSGQVALLDRLGRGVIYDVTWPSQNGLSVTTQFRRIAQDSFILEDGRSYQFVLMDGGLSLTSNPSNFNVYLELQFNTSPNPDVPTGTVVQRAVIANGDKGTFALPPIIWAASSHQTAIDYINRSLPAGQKIYWQLNFNLSGAPVSAYTTSEFGNSRGLAIIDVGSAYPTRPTNGADPLADVHDYSSTGSSSGSTSSGTTATSHTVQTNASWSRSWNNSGASIVSGSSQYTNSKALYQGNGASAMGSEFGFSSSFLSQFAGKTITSAYIYLKNAYQAYSGKSAILSTTGDTSAPSTISGSGGNDFTKGFSAGQGQWITLSSAIRSGLSSGSVKAFRLGVDGSDSNYMYFEGVGYGSHPPQLKVTYH